MTNQNQIVVPLTITSPQNFSHSPNLMPRGVFHSK